jgi:lipid A ethanolaminephosphotransferase
VLLLLTDVGFPPLRHGLKLKALSISLSVIVIGLIAALYFKDYASVIRNNPLLRRQVVPVYAIDSVKGYVKKTYFAHRAPHRTLSPEARLADPARNRLVVLVVGETQRAMNYGQAGYARDTDKFTRAQGVMYFRDVTSCGTATAVSVPCMFSNLTREGYDEIKAEGQDNLLDIAKRAGVNALWLDNDSGCKGVCGNVAYEDLTVTHAKDPALCGDDGCLDAVFLKSFPEKHAALTPEGTHLVVLHIMGSHGPTYFARYPRDRATFTPECPRSDIQNCTTEELVNTYDNTIQYADWVIAGIIERLKADTSRETALLFVSDHGESLGEKGVYLHGLPYFMAPKEQTHVPLMLWMSQGFSGLDSACIRGRLLDAPASHDNLFHTVLGLLGVEAESYTKRMDMLAGCRNK